MANTYFLYTDNHGTTHVVESVADVPALFRQTIKKVDSLPPAQSAKKSFALKPFHRWNKHEKMSGGVGVAVLVILFLRYRGVRSFFFKSLLVSLVISLLGTGYLLFLRTQLPSTPGKPRDLTPMGIVRDTQQIADKLKHKMSHQNEELQAIDEEIVK